MNYEVNDYRTPPEKPKLGSWPLWQVPEVFALSYVIRLALVLFVLPYLFGVQLTVIGLFFTFVIFDYFTYVALKKAYGLE